MKYIDAEKLKERISRLRDEFIKKSETKGYTTLEYRHKAEGLSLALQHIDSLQQEQPDEQPEYGYLYTEHVHGKKSRWSVGDVLAYYISTSTQEGEYLLGKIVNVEFDEEDGWIYTFEDDGASDEQSLVEEGTYKKN